MDYFKIGKTVTKKTLNKINDLKDHNKCKTALKFLWNFIDKNKSSWALIFDSKSNKVETETALLVKIRGVKMITDSGKLTRNLNDEINTVLIHSIPKEIYTVIKSGDGYVLNPDEPRNSDLKNYLTVGFLTQGDKPVWVRPFKILSAEDTRDLAYMIIKDSFDHVKPLAQIILKWS